VLEHVRIARVASEEAEPARMAVARCRASLRTRSQRPAHCIAAGGSAQVYIDIDIAIYIERETDG